jgi:dTMP kinase
VQAQLTEKFLTIEGIEGVGKSTAVKFIQQYLTQHNQQFIVTREPGGTVIAEQIRHILLTPNTEERMTIDTELLLMFASRAQHIAHVILPALQAKKWVVSDRFVDATYAYQGGGREMQMAQINQLDQWIVGQVQPRRTILLDAPAAIGLARAKHRGPQDRIEQEKVDFFERVRAVYLERAAKFSHRFIIVDATQSLEQVQAELANILAELIK